VPDGEIEIEVRGDAGATPALVLVHGAPDRSTSFGPVVPHLADLRVVLFDRRGYGRSLELPTARSMRDHAEDLLDVMTRGGSPCAVVAHSFGSNPTMLAATLRPDLFGALGLWEPPLPWVDWWPQRTKDFDAEVASSDDPAGTIEAMYRRMLGEDTWDAMPADRRERRRGEGVAFRADMQTVLDAPYAFADVAVPTLVGYGTATSPEHVEGAAWLVDQLPDAHLYAVPGAGHFANRTHPEEFARFVRLVVARVERPGEVTW
jgi:pimeloyl-ACP methyl ester carboxylesterase